MTHSLTQNPAQNSVDQLWQVLTLAEEMKEQGEATQQFAALIQGVTDNPEMSEFLTVLWNEVISARRSAAFWQQISDVEKAFTDRLTADHVQLKQNHLRLMQEM